MFGMDIRMVDWEEGGYRLGDQPRPRGELVIGGKSVSQGYFKVRLLLCIYQQYFFSCRMSRRLRRISSLRMVINISRPETLES